MQLPSEFEIREYQDPLWDYMAGGGKRAVCVWHRRAGKDLLCANWAAYDAARQPGNYWHMFPMSIQGRTALWNKVDAGRRVIDQIFPPWYVVGRSDVNMTLKLRGGSTWQILGSDNYENSIGANPRGIVFSEWSLTNPQAWEYMRPILRENGGWAIFIFTPRWVNHGYDMYQLAKKQEDWFCQLLTVRDTGFEHLMKAELRDGMPEDLAQQEYMCSFTALNHGSIYGKDMEEVESGGRITHVGHDPYADVHPYFDLGWRDATAIWFVQYVGNAVHLIDYQEDSFKTPRDYAALLRGETPETAHRKAYRYASVCLPHDARQHHLSAGGVSVEEQFRDFGFQVEIVGSKPITDRGFTADRINAVRRILPLCFFDAKHTTIGVKALQSYVRKWDEERKVFSDRPEHDWSSHGCDAFGLMAVDQERQRLARAPKRRAIIYPDDHISNMVI